MKRETYQSRGVLKRKEENKAQKTRKLYEKNKFEAISDFRRKNLFSNYKLCSKCESSYSSAHELLPNDDLFKELCLAEKPHLKRMNTYWACTSCFEGYFKEQANQEHLNLISLKMVEDCDGSSIFYPNILHEMQDLTDISRLSSDAVMTGLKMFSPNTLECTKLISHHSNASFTPNILSIIYKNGNISSQDLALIFFKSTH